jgi:hypothetical protein
MKLDDESFRELYMSEMRLSSKTAQQPNSRCIDNHVQNIIRISQVIKKCSSSLMNGYPFAQKIEDSLWQIVGLVSALAAYVRHFFKDRADRSRILL